MGTSSRGFRTLLRTREKTLFGTFVKSPPPHGIEIIADVGFDYVVIDQEHAPLDRISLDISVLAARAAGIAALVRVPSSAPSDINAALDLGADGVLAPHIRSASDALEFVSACRYAMGRGFSNSTRAGGYGARSVWQHVDAADREVTAIAMIEDPDAFENIDEILKVDGLDGVFIGRGDLSVALNDRATGAPNVAELTDRAVGAARDAEIPVMILSGGTKDFSRYRDQGVMAFVISSDQGFLRAGADQSLRAHKCA